MTHHAGSRLTPALTTLALAAGGALATPPVLLWAATAFQESAGQVVMEAEHDQTKTPRSNHDWLPKTSQSGFAGEGYMEATPNTGTQINTGYVTTSPELVFNVVFSTTGTYYVWVRGSAPTGSDDSLHAGLDGQGPASADRLTGFGTSWTWKRTTMDSAPATLQVLTPGLHTVHLWMREDGLKVDRFLLRISSTTPSGTGPAESPQVPVGGDTTAPTVSLTNPAAGATVSGTTPVTANAGDNVGVVGVQFRLDGANLGAEDTTSPYGVSWDTTTATNGSHTLTAVARDAAGNSKTSDPVTVTVSNAPDTTAPVLTFTSPKDRDILVAP